MVLPQQGKDSQGSTDESRKKTKMTISNIVNGDKALEAEIRELSKSEDDPLILFSWNMIALNEFWDKAVQYGATPGANHVPPPAIFSGNHPTGTRTLALIQQMQRDIVAYVANQTGSTVIWHDNAQHQPVGLACNCVQLANACILLRHLSKLFWFQAVLATGAPLTGTLATLFMPRPKNQTGQCDALHFVGSMLWT